MKSRNIGPLVLCCLLIPGFAGVWKLQEKIDTQFDGMHQEADDLVLRSGKLLKVMSLEYAPLMADVYWTRVVQYYGDKEVRQDANLELLWPLLDVTTTLDPHLLVAYRFGSMFLSENAPRGSGATRSGDRVDSTRNRSESGVLAALRRLGIHLLLRTARLQQGCCGVFARKQESAGVALDEGARRKSERAGRQFGDVGIFVDRDLHVDVRSADERERGDASSAVESGCGLQGDRWIGG